jgi:hypothetical protein
MDFVLEGGVHRVRVTFGMTPLRGLGLGLSLATVVLLGVTGGRNLLRRRLSLSK